MSLREGQLPVPWPERVALVLAAGVGGAAVSVAEHDADLVGATVTGIVWMTIVLTLWYLGPRWSWRVTTSRVETGRVFRRWGRARRGLALSSVGQVEVVTYIGRLRPRWRPDPTTVTISSYYRAAVIVRAADPGPDSVQMLAFRTRAEAAAVGDLIGDLVKMEGPPPTVA